MSGAKIKTTFGVAAKPAAPDIKTRTELDRLKARLSKPSPQMQLTPKGPIRGQVNAMERFRNQSRLGQLKHALDKSKGEMERGFAINSNRGRAKADFDRSR